MILTIHLTLFGQATIDRKAIAILPYKTNQIWMFKDRAQAKINDGDFATIDRILKECIYAYNIVQEKEFNKINNEHPEYNLRKENFVIDLKNYKRQYILATNLKGEKEVWINCFCNTSKNWNQELIIVKDGGNCYFNLIINLTTEKYSTLSVNGNA